MSRLVIVVPLREGTKDRARALLEEGPPFELEETQLERHEVFLTDHEVIFVFEAPGDEPPLQLQAGNPLLRTAATAWKEYMAGRPRKAETAFFWERQV